GPGIARWTLDGFARWTLDGFDRWALDRLDRRTWGRLDRRARGRLDRRARGRLDLDTLPWHGDWHGRAGPGIERLTDGSRDRPDMTRERARVERRDLDKERGEPLAGGGRRGARGPSAGRHDLCATGPPVRASS